MRHPKLTILVHEPRQVSSKGYRITGRRYVLSQLDIGSGFALIYEQSGWPRLGWVSGILINRLIFYNRISVVICILGSVWHGLQVTGKLTNFIGNINCPLSEQQSRKCNLLAIQCTLPLRFRPESDRIPSQCICQSVCQNETTCKCKTRSGKLINSIVGEKTLSVLTAVLFVISLKRSESIPCPHIHFQCWYDVLV